MSHGKKSVVVLGNGGDLKKTLVTNILGKELSRVHKTRILKETDLYEEDTFRFMCAPDLSTDSEDIRELLTSSPRPDMSVLVVERGFSPEQVWGQIDQLAHRTRRGTDEFLVVLPLAAETGDYPFKFCTVKDLIMKLNEDRNSKPPYKSSRYEGHPEPRPAAHASGGTELPRGPRVNFILLGLAGTGKSACGNTILGRDAFVSRTSSNPVTAECQKEDTVLGRRDVRVIDTPDIFDDDIKGPTRKKTVEACKRLCQSGESVYLLVMKVSRFTDCERDILKKLEDAFGRSHDRTVLLFTCGEDLRRDGMDFDKFLSDCQPDLRRIIDRCGKRCVLFENKDPGPDQKRRQMEELIRVVHRALTGSDPVCRSAAVSSV